MAVIFSRSKIFNESNIFYARFAAHFCFLVKKKQKNPEQQAKPLKWKKQTNNLDEVLGVR